MKIFTRLHGDREVGIGDKVQIEVVVDALDPYDGSAPMRFKGIGWTHKAYEVLNVIPCEIKAGDKARSIHGSTTVSVLAIHGDYIWCKLPNGECITYKRDVLIRES